MAPAGGRFDRGYVRLYVEPVLQAPDGRDFDFLVGQQGFRRHSAEDAEEDGEPGIGT